MQLGIILGLMLIEFGRGLVMEYLIRGSLVNQNRLAEGLLLLEHVVLAIHEICQSRRGMDLLHEGSILPQKLRGVDSISCTWWERVGNREKDDLRWYRCNNLLVHSVIIGDKSTSLVI